MKNSLYESESDVILSIHHLNSTYKKSSASVISRVGDQEVELLKKVNGVCDLFLNADFENGEYAEINLWDEFDRSARKLKSFEGVEYQLKFRR